MTDAVQGNAGNLAADPKRASSPNAPAWSLGLLLALYLALGLAYSLVVPPFETPDEPFHYGFARHIAQGNGLPVQSAEESGPWAQEGSQAPLYYLLTGWLTAAIDQEDFAAIAVRNPRANIGDPLDPGNKNFMLFSGRQPALVGSNLALHIGRWFSLLLGAITLVCVYLTTELLCGGRGTRSSRTDVRRDDEIVPAGPCAPTLPLLATALVALIPQFLFISASFSNDTLIMAVSAAAIYWLARLLVKPAEQPLRAFEWIVLGLLLGAAALSKLQGLGLVPVAGLVVLRLAWRRRDWRILWRAALLVGLPALAVAGWWYLRNIQLYGDWSGLGHLTAINGARSEPLTPADFWPEFRGLRFSFWGLFGWFNLLLPTWFYTLADLLTAVGVIGLAAAAVQMGRAAPRPALDHAPLAVLTLLLVWAVLIFLLLIYWITQATGSQGRLIFPAIIAYGPLLALGLDFWLRLLPRGGRGLLWGGLLLTLLGVSIYSLSLLLPQTYNAPQPIAALPATAQPVDLVMGSDEPVQLAAIEVSADRYRRGERVPVTLYWRAPQPLTANYQLFIQFLDESGREVANLTSHPGWGRNPTTFWEPGQLYADPYQVLVSGEIDPASPLLARVYTGLIDPQSEEIDNLPLPAFTAKGVEVTPFVATVELAAHQAPTAPDLQPAAAVFGGVITLAGHTAAADLTAAAPLTVTLLWEALAPPATDYTAYVHLLDASGSHVAGFDQAPAGDRFPTRRWRSGDRILSTFALDLPAALAPGDYALWVGLYETESNGAMRLPVTEAGGLPAGDGQVEIGRVTVNP